MGVRRKKFGKWLETNMKKLRLSQLDLICFQEVSRHWAEEARGLLQRQGILGLVPWALVYQDKKAILMKDEWVGLGGVGWEGWVGRWGWVGLGRWGWGRWGWVGG